MWLTSPALSNGIETRAAALAGGSHTAPGARPVPQASSPKASPTPPRLRLTSQMCRRIWLAQVHSAGNGTWGSNPKPSLKGEGRVGEEGLYSTAFSVCMYMCWGAEIKPSPIVSPVCHSLVSSSGQSPQQTLSKHRPGKPCAPGWLPASSSVVFCPVLWAGKQLGSLG